MPYSSGQNAMRHYIVGIDLGTTHTVVAYAPLPGQAAPGVPAEVQLLHIAQLVAPGQVAALPLLASTRYHPGVGELAEHDVQLPWPVVPQENASAPPAVLGQWARQLGAQVPGRLVTSAKSWLSHPAVDRLAPILPWGAAPDVAKISPVAASASYLRHVRAAWNQQFPAHPLEQQELVLTVPASFDESARALTLSAAQQAGLPQLRLLEEPQAVFYDWLLRHRATLASELAHTKLVLVCDVGGGTTDLSLIQVELRDGEPCLTRIGVGRHLMLGGDNMDLALAHHVEARMAAPTPDASSSTARQPLSAGKLAQLLERCRVAKEQLLANQAPAQTLITLLGSGTRLIGASRSVTLTRTDAEQLIVEGFFPQVSASAQVRASRSGIVEFGLPYARDPAITRHLADFLRQHDSAVPDTLLLNGGVFRAPALVQRLQDTLGEWRGQPLHLLHNDNPDVAVARGAVAYALAQHGLAPSIGGGSARSYFLLLEDTPASEAATRRLHGVCLLPRGSQTGQELLLTQRIFALRLGQPVRFHLFSTLSDSAGQATPTPGQLVSVDESQAMRLPPITLVLQADAAASSVKAPRKTQETAVQLAVCLTEVGTLELHCVSLKDATQRWLLEFDLRHHADDALSIGDAAAPDRASAARQAAAIEKIDHIFGPSARAVVAKDVRQLRAQLEHILGPREQWPLPLLRQLFDALWQRARGRRRSAEHERVWLNLSGYCLRPGFGDTLDAWRLQQLWSQFAQGAQHAHDRQVCVEWWTLWRRVAGGLAAPEQLRLLEDFAFNLQHNHQGSDGSAPPPVQGSNEDMLRLGAALEHIPVDYKVEIGQWLLTQIGQSVHEGPHLWALGRIGARQPCHGHLHDVVPPEVAADWVEALLALDWKRLEPAAFAATHLARVTDDRTRDLPLALRQRIVQRLQAINAPTIWVEMVRQRVELDEVTQRRVLGEALPPGLKLMA